ncbi:MAG: glycosyltransferase family 4 protein [Candidatus Marinimicrobia bacterium]|nr:glycosyltransferase family 4 protein [Candidatus Neomarinimicrobiota bacterium]MCF7829829.1 glycosyltransferase family 4 protein [Candidatus Neomarinimicrobiota bacterium]MCF7881738.1 glycosyltransferase family 4 protein [Candidatus Neomarinimicrobiota bacterium]
MSSERKTLLVLTYYFPPAGGPGVQRVLKHVKYLPEFGWDPVVITVDGGDFPARDASLADEIPNDVPVFRVPALEPYSLYRKFTGKSEDEHIPVGTLAKEDANTGLTERVARWIRANLFVPDARIGWIWPVIRRASNVIPRYKVDAILCSSPPHSVHLAAYRLARKFNLPWIADLRDPWTDIYYYQELNRSRLTRSLDRYLERKVFKSPDGVLTVSPSLVDQIQSRAANQKVTLLPNGYDAGDFDRSVSHSYERFTLSYIGNLKANQNPPALWKAIGKLIEQIPGFADDFQLYLTGKTHPQVETLLEKYGLADYVKIDGYVPHHEATRRMQSAGALLFIVPDAEDNEGILTGKLFEYLAAGRPIFSIGPPDGDAARILKDAEAGSMLNYSDETNFVESLGKLYRHWKNQDMETFLPNLHEVQRFERSEQSRILSVLLEEALNRAN